MLLTCALFNDHVLAKLIASTYRVSCICVALLQTFTFTSDDRSMIAPRCIGVIETLYHFTDSVDEPLANSEISLL